MNKNKIQMTAMQELLKTVDKEFGREVDGETYKKASRVFMDGIIFGIELSKNLYNEDVKDSNK